MTIILRIFLFDSNPFPFFFHEFEKYPVFEFLQSFVTLGTNVENLAGWLAGWWRGGSCLCIRVADSTIFQEIRHRVSARLTKRDLRDPTRKFQAGDRRNHVITSLMSRHKFLEGKLEKG